MAEVAPFDADETRCLERLPFHVFFLIAGADGVVDEKEFERFVHGLIDLASAIGEDDAGPDSELLANSGRYFDSLHPEVKRQVAQGGAAGSLAQISAGVALLDAKLDATQAIRFKRVITELGVGIAEASGGILGMRSISKVEREALDRLAAVLGPLG